MDKRKQILKICKWIVENIFYDSNDFLPYQEMIVGKINNPKTTENEYNDIVKQLISVLNIKPLINDLGLEDFETDNNDMNEGKMKKEWFNWNW